jgi:hypothetical protein
MSNKFPMINEDIERNIYMVRGAEVMLDSDIASIYEVETKRINEAVKNNPKKFPDDLMFELTQQEAEQILRSKISTSSKNSKKSLCKR